MFSPMVNMLKNTESPKTFAKLSNTVVNLIALISESSPLEAEGKDLIVFEIF